MNTVLFGDCLMGLDYISPANLIYIDPPFNTGKRQQIKGKQYEDTFIDFEPWLMERITKAYTKLTDNGEMFIHLDWHEVHYIKVACDKLFGRANCLNEIIWSYDYGGRGKTVWPRKHDTILWYVKDTQHYTYNYEAIDRIPYMAPDLQTPERAALGKVPTDVWWSTIVPTNSKERVNYPTQKPRTIIDRIIRVHSNEGDHVLDFFAGSGTVGESAKALNRTFTLIDNNPQAIEVIFNRVSPFYYKELV